MVGIGTGGIIAGILWRSDTKSTRHMEKVLNADFSARVSGCLPFGDRGRLTELIRASVEQDAKQRGGNALAHGPAFERGTHAYSVAIALCNEVAFPGDDEGCRQSLGWFESRVDSRLEFCRIDFARQRLIPQHITHGPRRAIGIRQFTLYDDRREMDRGVTERKGHAALAAKVFGR